MNQTLHQRIRWAARIAAAAVAACALLLTISYAAARFQAPRDAKTVAELQKKVREDASFAPRLEAEHKRITAALQQRRKRDDVKIGRAHV